MSHDTTSLQAKPVVSNQASIYLKKPFICDSPSVSLVGEDSNNRVLAGTTRDAFFTLDALSRFLLAAPLDLTAALNLDGGPVACQGIALGSFRRHVYGRWEFQANETGGHLLHWLYGSRFAMPVVLAVFPK